MRSKFNRVSDYLVMGRRGCEVAGGEGHGEAAAESAAGRGPELPSRIQADEAGGDVLEEAKDRQRRLASRIDFFVTLVMIFELCAIV